MEYGLPQTTFATKSYLTDHDQNSEVCTEEIGNTIRSKTCAPTSEYFTPSHNLCRGEGGNFTVKAKNTFCHSSGTKILDY